MSSTRRYMRKPSLQSAGVPALTEPTSRTTRGGDHEVVRLVRVDITMSPLTTKTIVKPSSESSGPLSSVETDSSITCCAAPHGSVRDARRAVQIFDTPVRFDA